MDSDEFSRLDYYELTTQTMLFVGVLAIGIALGSSWGLAELQTSCMESGRLPQAGNMVLTGALDENACWDGALRMQSIANASGLIGGVLLISGGIIDRYDERIRDLL